MEQRDRSEAARRRGRAGHRSVPHTADLRIEAWAGTREECVAEAVRAVTGSFVRLSGLRPERSVTFQATGRDDADLLVATLDELVYLLDVGSDVPVTAEVSAVPDGLRVEFGLAPLSPERVVGAVPKAVTLHDLEFGPVNGAVGGADDGQWRCAVTLDV